MPFFYEVEKMTRGELVYTLGFTRYALKEHRKGVVKFNFSFYSKQNNADSVLSAIFNDTIEQLGLKISKGAYYLGQALRVLKREGLMVEKKNNKMFEYCISDIDGLQEYSDKIAGILEQKYHLFLKNTEITVDNTSNIPIQVEEVEEVKETFTETPETSKTPEDNSKKIVRDNVRKFIGLRMEKHCPSIDGWTPFPFVCKTSRPELIKAVTEDFYYPVIRMCAENGLQLPWNKDLRGQFEHRINELIASEAIEVKKADNLKFPERDIGIKSCNIYKRGKNFYQVFPELVRTASQFSRIHEYIRVVECIHKMKSGNLIILLAVTDYLFDHCGQWKEIPRNESSASGKSRVIIRNIKNDYIHKWLRANMMNLTDDYRESYLSNSLNMIEKLGVGQRDREKSTLSCYAYTTRITKQKLEFFSEKVIKLTKFSRENPTTEYLEAINEIISIFKPDLIKFLEDNISLLPTVIARNGIDCRVKKLLECYCLENQAINIPPEHRLEVLEATTTLLPAKKLNIREAVAYVIKKAKKHYKYIIREKDNRIKELEAQLEKLRRE